MLSQIQLLLLIQGLQLKVMSLMHINPSPPPPTHPCAQGIVSATLRPTETALSTSAHGTATAKTLGNASMTTAPDALLLCTVSTLILITKV
jgi:hypothetical protein